MDLWADVLNRLKSRISETAFVSVFQQTALICLNEDTLVIRVPDAFTKTLLTGRYADLIRAVLADAGWPNVVPEYLPAEE
jgi:chromosomal replication initiation ATPase DnaA